MNSEDLKGTQTEKNLMSALQGEALAHLKYQFYKSKLVEENKGYEQLLDEIIHNEKEHGKLWFKLLHDGAVPSNEVNLVDAIQGENYESEEMYVNFGDVAYEEGFGDIADLFYQVAEIEGDHAFLFEAIKYELENKDLLYKSIDDNDDKWKCLNCGHVFTGKEAPVECPVCKHPQKYFVRL